MNFLLIRYNKKLAKQKNVHLNANFKVTYLEIFHKPS